MNYGICLLIATSILASPIHRHGAVQPCAVNINDKPTVISFSNGIIFDTRAGEPEFTEDLSYKDHDETQYYLVQCRGPIRRQWIEALRSDGVGIITYIPNYTLLVYANSMQTNTIKSFDFVNWLGLFHPAYKIDQALQDIQGTHHLVIQLSPLENARYVMDQLRNLGVEIIDYTDGDLCKTIDVNFDLQCIDKIARIPGVLAIQLWHPVSPCNDNAQWCTQTGYQSAYPGSDAWRIWNEGLKGNGIVLSTSDSGIRVEHVQFFDTGNPIMGPGVYPNHRKIVGYKLLPGATFGEYLNGPHGTHVSCTVAGNDTLLGTSIYDGMSKEARIYHVDLANNYGGWFAPWDCTALLDSVHLANGLNYNVLQHSGSWGFIGNSNYQIPDATTDAYVWAHRDFLNIFAAGNESNAFTIRSPGCSKNVITVGATLNGISCQTIAPWSSRGPTQDGRIKPTLMAPGQGRYHNTGLWSADGATTDQYRLMAGTSMATPVVNGSIGLIRQYLLAGFYPSGQENPSDSVKYQSAALLRAMAIVSCDPNINPFVVPDSNIGWGRIDLDSVLYFDGDTRKLILLDDTIGVNTGQSIADSFRVLSSMPLRVCVVWTDTAAAPLADPTLVNDLNVELTAPSGAFYRGNIYAGGESVVNPSIWDDRNTEECCRINNPEVGVWHITISGNNIPYGPQPYAYAITGNITENTGIEEDGRIWEPGSSVKFHTTFINNELMLDITLSSTAHVEICIYDLTGRVVEEVVKGTRNKGKHTIEERIQLPSGVYFVKVSINGYSETRKVLLVK